MSALKLAYTIEFFHGTSTKFLHRIMKEGLSSSPRQRIWEEGYKREPGQIGLESYPGAYVSNNFMVAYSASTTAIDKFGGNRLFIIGKIETRTPEARIDEDHVQEPGMGIAIEDKLVSDWYRSSRLLDYFAFEVDEQALIGASKTWVEKALKIKPTDEVMKKAISALRAWLDMRIALEVEKQEKGGSNWSGIINKIKERFNDNIPEKYKDVKKAIQAYRGTMDEFLAKAKELLEKSKSDNYITNVRLTKPIAYKGANKIEAIIEVDDKGYKQGEKVDIIVHYAISTNAIGLFIQQYENNIGRNYEMK